MGNFLRLQLLRCHPEQVGNTGHYVSTPACPHRGLRRALLKLTGQSRWRQTELVSIAVTLLESRQARSGDEQRATRSQRLIKVAQGPWRVKELQRLGEDNAVVRSCRQ